MSSLLGRKVKDRVTGFTGLVTGYVQYLTGCNQYLVAPPVDKDGKIPDSHWFDEQRCEVVDSSKLELLNAAAGFDKEPPKR